MQVAHEQLWVCKKQNIKIFCSHLLFVFASSLDNKHTINAIKENELKYPCQNIPVKTASIREKK